MARVPQLLQPQVKNIGDQTPFQSGPIPSGAFGVEGLIEAGQAIGGVGDDVFKIALAEQAIDNERLAKKEETGAFTDLNTLFHGNGKDVPGFYNLKGEAAINAYATLAGDIETIRKKYRDNLGDNEKAGRMYDKSFNARITNANVSIAKHLGASKIFASLAVSDARLGVAVETASVGGGMSEEGEALIESSLQTINSEVEAQLELGGFKRGTPEGELIYKNELSKAYGVLFDALIQNKIKAGQTLEAEALLEKYGSIMPEAIEANLSNLLKTPVLNTKAAGLVESIRAEAAERGWDLSKQEVEIRRAAKGDVALADESIKRFKARNVLDKKRLEESRDKAFASAMSRMNKGEVTLKQLETTEPELMALINQEPRMAANLRDADKARREGQLYRDVSDVATLDFLEEAAKNKKLYLVNPSDVRGSLTEADAKFWRNKIMADRALRNDQSDLAQQSTIWRKEILQKNPDLRLSKGKKKLSEGKQARYDFIDEEMVQFAQRILNSGKQPTLAEYRERLDELNLEVQRQGTLNKLLDDFLGGVPLSEFAAGTTENEQLQMVIDPEELKKDASTWNGARKFMTDNGTKSFYTDQEIASFLTAKILTQEERAANIIGKTVQARRPPPSLEEIREATKPKEAEAPATTPEKAPTPAPEAPEEAAEVVPEEAAEEEGGATEEDLAAVEALFSEVVEEEVPEEASEVGAVIDEVVPELTDVQRDEVEEELKAPLTTDQEEEVDDRAFDRIVRLFFKPSDEEVKAIRKEEAIKVLAEAKIREEYNDPSRATPEAEAEVLEGFEAAKGAKFWRNKIMEAEALLEKAERAEEHEALQAERGELIKKRQAKVEARAEALKARQARAFEVQEQIARVSGPPPAAPVPDTPEEAVEVIKEIKQKFPELLPKTDSGDIEGEVTPFPTTGEEEPHPELVPQSPEEDISPALRTVKERQKRKVISIVRAALSKHEGPRGSNVSGDPATGKEGLSNRRWNDMKKKSGNPDLSEDEAIDMVLEEDFATISKVEGWDGISIDAQVAVLDMTYNITSKWAKIKNKFKFLKAAMKKGDSVEVVRQTLDTANKTVGNKAKSMMGLALRRARHYNDAVEDVNKKIYDVNVNKETGKVIYKGKTKEILSYTPSGGKHVDSESGTTILIKRPDAGLVGGA